MKDFLILTYGISERNDWFYFLYEKLKDACKITACKECYFIKGKDFIIHFVSNNMKSISGIRSDFHFGDFSECTEYLRNIGSIELSTLDDLVEIIKGDLMKQTIKFNHGKRPCTVDGEKGYFHLWENYSRPVDASPLVGGAPAGIISCVFGIVEFTDGVRRVEPTSIVFTDKEE